MVGQRSPFPLKTVPYSLHRNLPALPPSLPLPWGPGSLPHHQPLLLFPSEAPQNILTHPLTQVESISVPTYCSQVGCGPQLSPLFMHESMVYTCLCAYVCKWMNVCLCMPGHACICTCKYMCVSKLSSPWQLGRRILLPLSHSVCHSLPQSLRSRQTCILHGPR